MHELARLLLLLLAVGCSGFTLTLPVRSSCRAPSRHASIKCLVTAEDVEIAVEKCERLWADVMEARKKVEQLSNEAEELTEASEKQSAEANAKVEASDTFKLSMLGDMKAATDSQLNANAMIGEAFEAAEEAERLEALAEAAMAEMDAAIEAHLIDFPDSELRDELE
jgi:hypothetical protein